MITLIHATPRYHLMPTLLVTVTRSLIFRWKLGKHAHSFTFCLFTLNCTTTFNTLLASLWIAGVVGSDVSTANVYRYSCIPIVRTTNLGNTSQRRLRLISCTWEPSVDKWNHCAYYLALSFIQQANFIYFWLLCLTNYRMEVSCPVKVRYLHHDYST